MAAYESDRTHDVTLESNRMGSEALLEANVATARAFKPMSADAQAKLLAKTREAALTGQFEPYKTAPNYDGPIGRKLHGVK